MLPQETSKFISSEIARNAYFSVYAHKGLINLAVKLFLGSGSVTISGWACEQLDSALSLLKN